MFVLAILAVVFSASAEEYKSMIRYDRVWEHVSIYYNMKDVYYVRFDGPEEINGKTYHRLVSFRHARYDYGSDLQPYVFDVDDSYYKHEGYLREEDGKVYTLLSDAEVGDGYCRGTLYIPGGKGSHPANLEEKVIYDFSCKEGESYQGLHIAGNFAEEMTYHVKSIENVEIDGEEHRLMRISIGEHEDMREPIVEGIGIASEGGCLTTINFFDRPTCPCWNYLFNRVLSTDGRVLYRAEYGASEIPVGDLSGVDRVAATPETDVPLYDILGHRITEAVPGQLYIQGGKKHIAK